MLCTAAGMSDLKTIKNHKKVSSVVGLQCQEQNAAKGHTMKHTVNPTFCTEVL